MKIRSVFVSSVMQNYADRSTAARQTLQELDMEGRSLKISPPDLFDPRPDQAEHSGL